MAIGLSADQRALAQGLREWAQAAELAELVKASETAGSECFESAWQQIADFGVPGIALPESLGGAGGSFTDAAVAIEACGYAMAPGPILSTVVAGVALLELDGAEANLSGLAAGEVRVALALPDRVLYGVGLATHALTGTGLVALEGEPSCVDPFDFSSRLAQHSFAPLDQSRVRQILAALAAAEASGIARWCLETAVSYAKVREQFGQPIGRFQAIKHLCAEMLERAESATALAWDAANAYDESAEQFALAATAAGAGAVEAAVRNAQACIQILGGIGFTFEHHAHLYLRRAMQLRQLLGGRDALLLDLAELALAGQRRVVELATDAEAERYRDGVRADLARIGDDRVALAESGLLMPHWPEPFGRAATAVQQLVIDQEFARAELHRPNLAIGAWAVPTILAHGTAAQQERFVGPTLTGELIWCQLFSEPGAGSDLASLRTKAERTDGGWLLTGQKVWTSLGEQAHFGICLARTNPDAPAHKGITYFLVDMKTPGIEIRPLREMTGEALFNEVFLDQVFVPDECVVGEIDAGWPLARTTLANERVAMSGSSFGISVECALEVAAERAPIDAALQLRLGEAVLAAVTAKALGLRVTLRSIAGQGPGPESSVQKLVGVVERQNSAELVFELLGAEVLLGSKRSPAVIQEALVTRCLSIAGGTTQVLRNVAAERILGLPRG